MLEEKKVFWGRESHRVAGCAGDSKLGKQSALGLPVWHVSSKVSTARAQQQEGRNCLCEMLSLLSFSERKGSMFALIALSSVDPDIYLQILLLLKSLYVQIYRGSRFLGILLMEGDFYTGTTCFVLKTQPPAF